MKILPFLFSMLTVAAVAQGAEPGGTSILPEHTLAQAHYGNDAPWFEKNIPFFDCSDPEITDVYYYRWALYKAHLRDLGSWGYIATEFLDDVTWSKPPYQSLNDATGFHIHEGRWLADPRYVDNYIDFMYTGGGENRHFSDAIPDATYADYLVTGDRHFVTKHLDVMQHIFHLWDDHYDFAKDLYFIEPILDATEYSIASIDASGGQDGFNGGRAFRPTINSFMYANADAISKIAALAGDKPTARTFAATAEKIRTTVETQLWNDPLGHFVDRYAAGNRNVHYWDFIRGRELAGYTPWYFELPDSDAKYAQAWKYILAPDKFAGPFGLRTVEPSYQYYMRQYRYDKPTGTPECQWNGPAWPFDTTLILGGLANLLNDYKQTVVQPDDYVRLLKQYAHQHYLNGKLDLQEDYNPDTGNVIVGLARSHHYNHSGFNDLVISGLVGLRPRADDTLEVNPLIPAEADAKNPIKYFCLQNVTYHGQQITIVYDRDGSHYGKGAGLSIYVNGQEAVAHAPLGKKLVQISKPPERAAKPAAVDLAVNLGKTEFPTPTASVNATPDALFQAIDGRVWYYAEMPNYWTTAGSQSAQDWYALDLGPGQRISSVNLYFYADGKQFAAPSKFELQYWNGTDWAAIPGAHASPAAPIAGGENLVTFPAMTIGKLRAVFTNPEKAATALVELKAF